MADNPAEVLILEAEKVLFHGSLADKFTHEFLDDAGPSPAHYIHPPTPDGPAWFADNEKFALHAAIRFTKPGEPAQIQLHTYRVSYPIRMMSLADIDNFRVFMQEQYQVEAPENGIMEGIALAQSSIESSLEGYALLKDFVRGEPEYVLFAAGMKKLQFLEIRTIDIIPVNETESTLFDTTNGENREVARYTYDEGPGQLD